MSRILHLAFLMCLLSGCMTAKRAGNPESAFSELPQVAPQTTIPAYALPEPAADSVKQKAVAAYAKAYPYWFKIYSELRSCTHVQSRPGYVATFRKSGQPLAGIPSKDTRWHAVRVEFDDSLQIEHLYLVMY